MYNILILFLKIFNKSNHMRIALYKFNTKRRVLLYFYTACSQISECYCFFPQNFNYYTKYFPFTLDISILSK